MSFNCLPLPFHCLSLIVHCLALPNLSNLALSLHFPLPQVKHDDSIWELDDGGVFTLTLEKVDQKGKVRHTMHSAEQLCMCWLCVCVREQSERNERARELQEHSQGMPAL